MLLRALLALSVLATRVPSALAKPESVVRRAPSTYWPDGVARLPEPLARAVRIFYKNPSRQNLRRLYAVYGRHRPPPAARPSESLTSLLDKRLPYDELVTKFRYLDHTHGDVGRRWPSPAGSR